MRPLLLTLRMIKWEHTVFALPFALLSLLVAAEGAPAWSTLGWVLVAMVGARSTAMAFNRLVDHRIDAANPRTEMRELPSGALRRGPVIAFTLVTAAVFVFAAAMLNPLCLALSPVALAIVWFYSLTKRFTAASHFFLGLALGVAPIGAWLAVRGSFDTFPLVLAAAVNLWVAGFDILYACQDLDFDRSMGLHSVPASIGHRAARWVARVVHLGAVAAWVVAFRLAGFELVALVGVAMVAALLLYEHWLVRGGDLRRIDRAFFEVNSWVGMVLLGFALADLYLV
jgi:4-hydroxybenzoate polyprenyltransferase